MQEKTDAKVSPAGWKEAAKVSPAGDLSSSDRSLGSGDRSSRWVLNTGLSLVMVHTFPILVCDWSTHNPDL